MRGLRTSISSLDGYRTPGLHPLAPYLTQLIAAETAARLGSLPHLALLLGTAEALLQNPGIDMEPYVHQLLPAVVTCLVARRLGVRRHELWALTCCFLHSGIPDGYYPYVRTSSLRLLIAMLLFAVRSGAISQTPG